MVKAQDLDLLLRFTCLLQPNSPNADFGVNIKHFSFSTILVIISYMMANIMGNTIKQMHLDIFSFLRNLHWRRLGKIKRVISILVKGWFFDCVAQCSLEFPCVSQCFLMFLSVPFISLMFSCVPLNFIVFPSVFSISLSFPTVIYFYLVFLSVP